jgi:hypothetical protein
MKNFWLIAAIALLALSNVHNAAAFSTDSRNNQNSDGSPKFADPDEQMPGFVVAPDNARSGGRAPSSGFTAVTIPQTGENTPGARAFDEAFTRQQNRE